MSEQPTLEFWKNMALGLKDELVNRGDRIDDLEEKIKVMQEQIEEANDLVRAVYDSESLLTQKVTLDLMGYMTRYRTRKQGAQA